MLLFCFVFCGDNEGIKNNNIFFQNAKKSLILLAIFAIIFVAKNKMAFYVVLSKKGDEV